MVDVKPKLPSRPVIVLFTMVMEAEPGGAENVLI
jgi:hypothetical protein